MAIKDVAGVDRAIPGAEQRADVTCNPGPHDDATEDLDHQPEAERRGCAETGLGLPTRLQRKSPYDP